MAIGTDKKDGVVVPRSTAGTGAKSTTVQKDIRTETKAPPVKTTSTRTSDADWNKSATPNTRVGSDKKETAPAESRFSYVGHGSGIDKVERPSSGDVWAEASGGGSSSSGSSTGTSRSSTGGGGSGKTYDPPGDNDLSFGMLTDMFHTIPATNERYLVPNALDNLIAGGKGINFATGLPGSSDYLRRIGAADSSSTPTTAAPPVYHDNTLLMGPDAANDPYSAWHNLSAGLRSLGLMGPEEPASDGDYMSKPLEGLATRKVSTYAIDDNGNPIIPTREWPPAWTRYSERLPSEPVTGSLPPSIPDSNASVVDAIPSSEVDELGRRTSEFVEPPVAVDWHNLPADQRWGWKSPFADMGRTITGALGYDDPPSMNAPGYGPESQTSAEAGIDAATQEPSTWDNTGKLLSHFGLGAIVSTLFPDLWSAGGDMMKGMFEGERGTATANGDFTRWDPREGVSLGGGSSFSRDATGYVDTTPSRLPPGKNAPPGGTFPDLNHNGVDDRLEGYTGPDTQPPTTPSAAAYGRTVQFPDIPPYNPGRDDEWLYFLNNHLADGGMVEAPAYAGGGAIDQSDPRVQLIGQTEDVLERLKAGEKPDEAAARTLKAFVAQFGDAALKSLNDNVGEGLSMKGAGKGRQIKGPGGPKDDAVPAVIVEEGSVVSPAKLSNGEFVFSVDAVKGIGEGDVELGAERLQQLAERLSAGKKAA